MQGAGKAQTCASDDLKAVEVVDAHSLTPDEFWARFASQRIPVSLSRTEDYSKEQYISAEDLEYIVPLSLFYIAAGSTEIFSALGVHSSSLTYTSTLTMPITKHQVQHPSASHLMAVMISPACRCCCRATPMTLAGVQALHGMMPT